MTTLSKLRARVFRTPSSRGDWPALTLRELAEETTAPVLLSALPDPIAAVRAATLDALAALTPGAAAEAECARMLADRDSSCKRRRFAPSCESRGIRSYVWRGVTDAAKNVRLEVAHACALFDDEMVRALLADVEPDVRASVAWALLEAPRETLVAPLVSALADPDWHVRRAAARALGATRHDRGAEALVNALVDPHALVRAAALRSLHETFGTGLIDVLSARLGTENDSSRIAIVHGLATCDAGAASRRIAALRDDPSPDVRIAVAHTLANLKAPLPGGFSSGWSTIKTRPCAMPRPWRSTEYVMETHRDGFRT
jgi:HEAT repeat protein